MRAPRRLAAVVAAGLVLAGCAPRPAPGDPAPPAQPDIRRAPDGEVGGIADESRASRGLAARLAGTMLPLVARPRQDAAAGSGIVTGIASWQGSTPLKIKQLTNDVDVDACGARVQPGSMIAGPGGVLANVVVELRRASAPRRNEGEVSLPQPDAGVVIERCLQVPHVLLVPVGTAVTVENRDGILHELSALSVRNPPFQARLPRYRRRATVDPEHLARPERIMVSCETHPWAVAWWVVTASPHHALTGRDGRFHLTGVPAGEWKLVAWHEELGEIERPVDVRAGEPVQVDLAWR